MNYLERRELELELEKDDVEKSMKDDIEKFMDSLIKKYSGNFQEVYVFTTPISLITETVEIIDNYKERFLL